MSQYGVAEWHFLREGEKCLLRLSIAGNNLTTSGQHCRLLIGSCDEDPDDLDNFGWSELPETIEWLRRKCEELLALGWVLESTSGTADEHDISVSAPRPTDLAPWPEFAGPLGPAIL